MKTGPRGDPNWHIKDYPTSVVKVWNKTKEDTLVAHFFVPGG